MGSLAAAAALLAMVIGVASLLDHAGGRAFAQMIEKVKAASSVRFATAVRVGRRPEVDGQMYLEGNRLRLEQFGGMLIQVGDLKRKQALFLDMYPKLAQPTEIDANVAQRFAKLLPRLPVVTRDGGRCRELRTPRHRPRRQRIGLARVRVYV